MSAPLPQKSGAWRDKPRNNSAPKSQPPGKQLNSPRQVLFASLVGTAIEFFDFYIYATAAVLVFPKLFFPAGDPASATLASLATFGIAFLARPIGSALFGHFGDRIGRKRTLVVALATMGISTVSIGALPTYHSIGFTAPLLLAICRFGQGIGLGGEWGGAVLLAIENAPSHKRAWYGMFPQLGAPLGFFLAGGVFLVLSHLLTDQQFFAFGWRLPFLASAVLVFLGLYVRLTITETPVFEKAMHRGEQERLPVIAVFRNHKRNLVANDGPGLQPGKVPVDAAVRYAVFRRDHSDFSGAGGAWTPPGDALDHGWDLLVRAYPGSHVHCRHSRSAGHDGGGPDADGADVWAAGHSGFRAVSNACALFGQLAGVQFCGDSGGVAGAIHRDMAGQELWPSMCGLLPLYVGSTDVYGAARDSGDEGRRPERMAGLRQDRLQSLAAISDSLATVFMLRAVPFLAAGIFSLDSPCPSA
jgi:MFS family permease